MTLEEMEAEWQKKTTPSKPEPTPHYTWVETIQGLVAMVITEDGRWIPTDDYWDLGRRDR